LSTNVEKPTKETSSRHFDHSKVLFDIRGSAAPENFAAPSSLMG
jgi:hypothetical protein